MRTIDALLNKITMYRLVLYELIFLILAAGVLGYFDLLPYTPEALAFSSAFIIVIAWVVNKVFATVFDAPSNPESTYITALILVLIITPPSSLLDMNFLPLAGWAAALAMASKYILAWRKKHFFNPAALAVAVTSFAIGQSASWWVGTPILLPFVLVGGFLVTRKIQRFDLVFACVAAALMSIIGFDIAGSGTILLGISNGLFSSPLFFLATVMLTEPLTTPPSRLLRVPYGALVGFLFAPAVNVAGIYSTPELALLLGNIFSYIVSSKQKLVLTLKERSRLSSDVFEFVFAADHQPSFKPGQYMEWTLGHRWPDSRGIRRYFTLASSPTEQVVRLGVKFYANGSSFKKRLLAMRAGDTIVASQRAGDFTLPRNKKKKLVFIAGGIGITPFHSMIQYLLDTQEPRSMILLYSNKTPADVVYQDLLKEAEKRLGLKTIYAFSDPSGAPVGLPGVVAKFDAQTIAREVPDYRERTFYLSGPRGMVVAFSDALTAMGVHTSNIKKDFFPGFA